MYTTVTIICAILLEVSSGYPQDKPTYDVSKFISPRIVGGADAPEGYARYMVALVYGQFFKSLVCGASIITSRHVLSAAHCIVYLCIGMDCPELLGVIGSNYWNSSNIIEFSGFVNHPNWSWATLKNDIGVLVTTQPIDFQKHGVVPIAINLNWVKGRERAAVAGWGQTGVWNNVPYRLQRLDVTILTPSECIRGIEIAVENTGPSPPFDPALEICTIHSVQHGMCFGDSGSPLVQQIKDTTKMAGIVSWGFPCARGHPDVFVRVGAFKDFLNSVIGNTL